MRTRLSLLRVNAVLICLAAGAVAQPVFAQDGGAGFVIRRSAEGAIAARVALPVSDDALTTLLATAHFADSVASNPELNAITLVVDANGEYVSSQVKHMTMISVSGAHLEGGAASTTCASTAENAPCVTLRQRDPASAAAGEAMAGGMVSHMKVAMTGGSEIAEHGMFGTDFKAADIGSMGIKSFKAGDLLTVRSTVTVIKLK